MGVSHFPTERTLMRKRQMFAAAAMTAALGAGGMVGVVLGAPGVSSAQTDTTTPSTDPPATTAPAPTPAPGPKADGGQAHDCPNMGGSPVTPPGASPSSSGATNTGFHRGGPSGRTL